MLANLCKYPLCISIAQVWTNLQQRTMRGKLSHSEQQRYHEEKSQQSRICPKAGMNDKDRVGLQFITIEYLDQSLPRQQFNYQRRVGLFTKFDQQIDGGMIIFPNHLNDQGLLIVLARYYIVPMLHARVFHHSPFYFK